MSVYVDDFSKWPHARGIFRAGSSHLTADSLDELHELATRIGLKRAWFQRHHFAPHYDLIESKRKAALAAGATYMAAIEQAHRKIGRTLRAGGTLPNFEDQA